MSEQMLSEIQRAVFDQTVPLRVALHSVPVPLCFNAKRVVPLGIFAYSCLEPFLKREKEGLRDMHFRVNGQVVKWYLPIGVIYDSFAAKSSERALEPMTVEVKFECFPEGVALRCDSKDVVGFYFNHAFKESCYVTHRNMQLVQRNTNIHENIMRSVVGGDYDAFEANMGIVRGEVEQWKFYPFKFVSKKSRVFCCFLRVEDMETVGDVIGAAKNMLEQRNVGTTDLDDEISSLENNKVLFHGMHIPLETPLKEFAKSLIYPDGFVYGLIE